MSSALKVHVHVDQRLEQDLFYVDKIKVHFRHRANNPDSDKSLKFLIPALKTFQWRCLQEDEIPSPTVVCFIQVMLSLVS